MRLCGGSVCVVVTGGPAFDQILDGHRGRRHPGILEQVVEEERAGRAFGEVPRRRRRRRAAVERRPDPARAPRHPAIRGHRHVGFDDDRHGGRDARAPVDRHGLPRARRQREPVRDDAARLRSAARSRRAPSPSAQIEDRRPTCRSSPSSPRRSTACARRWDAARRRTPARSSGHRHRDRRWRRPGRSDSARRTSPTRPASCRRRCRSPARRAAPAACRKGIDDPPRVDSRTRATSTSRSEERNFFMTDAEAVRVVGAAAPKGNRGRRTNCVWSNARGGRALPHVSDVDEVTGGRQGGTTTKWRRHFTLSTQDLLGTRFRRGVSAGQGEAQRYGEAQQ